MAKLRLVNVRLGFDKYDQIDSFMIDKYSIFFWDYDHVVDRRYYRNHKQNAYAEFKGPQENSIMFRDGIYGEKYSSRKKIKRKLVDDILVVGSILNGKNWALISRKKYSNYPLKPINSLEDIIGGQTKNQVENYFSNAISCVKDKSWQIQYENGFHLIMLLNHCNIINFESRFLSNFVIWEWLYPHLKNPNGASRQDEEDDLNKIMSYILNLFWPHTIYVKNNIFIVLRNQLVHSGKLPINRTNAENWMKNLGWEDKNVESGVKTYIDFFNKLTQVIVLKTLGIDADMYIQHWLNNFLKSGKLSIY